MLTPRAARTGEGRAPATARMLFTAETSFGDLDGKSVCDLGCGCGMLMAASAMMGAGSVGRHRHGAVTAAGRKGLTPPS